MKRFFTVAIVVVSVFFVFACFLSDNYEDIANKITEKTAKKLQEQRNLRLVGTGGRMMDDIKEMDMSLNYYQEVNLQTARELLVFAINEYLLEINESKEVRPYLHNFPFTAKNLEIRIAIFTPDGRDPPSDKIYFISSINGTLSYYVEGEKKYSRKAICEETYEQARLKLGLKENGKLSFTVPKTESAPLLLTQCVEI